MGDQSPAAIAQGNEALHLAGDDVAFATGGFDVGGNGLVVQPVFLEVGGDLGATNGFELAIATR